MSVDPARSSSSRCSGVPLVDLLGQLRGDRGAQVAAGAAAHEPFEPGRRRIRLDLLDVALAAGHRVEVGAADDHRLARRAA